MKQKRTGRKSFLVLLSLLLVFMSVPLAAAADGSGSSNGNYVLKVETTGGNQWDGAQIGIDELDLDFGSTYTFSFDLFSPDQDVDGIVLQSNGSYSWIAPTGSLSADSAAWTTYTGDFEYTNASDEGKHIQFVKVGGTATTADNITYYIDNFVVKDKATDAVVYSADFESNSVSGFEASGSANVSTVAPPVMNYFLKIETTGGNQYDGAQVEISVTNMVYGSAYTFSFDLYSPDQDVDGIVLQSSGSYKWIVPTGPLHAGSADWTTYTGEFEFTSPNDVGEHIQFVKQYGFATETDNITYYIDNFVVKDNATDVVVYSADFGDKTVGDFTQSGSATLSVVHRATSTTPPPVSDEVVTAYNLQWDVELPNFVSYGGSTYLQKAGPNINAIGKPDGSVYLDLSNRTESWHGVDIRAFPLGLKAGYEYTVEVTGRIPDDVVIPGGAQIVLGGSDNPWAQLQTVDADRTFALSYSGTAAANTGETVGLRIQADVAINRFFIDSIIVTVKGGKAMPEGQPDIGVPDDYEWPDPAWDLSLPSLKEAYSKYFHIGNIIEPGQTTDEALTAMFKKQYNVVTAENAMKPDAMLGTMTSASDLSDPSKYNFEAADQIVAWAEENDQYIHGHTLVWHSQTPAFMNTGASGTRSAAQANMELFINHAIKHFDSPNVISWDVVNEAFDDDTSKFNGTDWRTGLRTNSPWYIAYANGADEENGESGADYIYDAFVFAHLAQADIGSTAALYYNDYNETYKYEQIAQMVESLNAQWEEDPRYDGRKLIEGVGMQSHFWIGQQPDVEEHEVVTTIERFIQAGVRISVSELDIPYANNRGYHLNAERQANQANQYATLFRIYKKYADHIDRVTFWGNADSLSWRGSGMPLLFDNSFRPKTAFYTVLNIASETTGGGGGGGGVIAPVTPADPREVKIEVNADDVKKALSEAKEGILKLQLQGSEDAQKVNVSIPVDQVKVAKEAGVNRIEISSGLATVQLPVSLFADAEGNANVELNIDTVDNSSLSEEQQALVGSNTVFDFNLSVGGQKITDFSQGQPVRVAVPYTLKPGESPGQIVIYYLADDGKLEVIKNGRYNKETGMVEFNAKHFSKYAAVARSVTFNDVKAVAWASESIEGLAARDIISGMTKDTFAPGDSITRAQFIQLLILALDLNQANATSTFSDAKQGEWYYHAVASAEQLGIVSGLTDGSFGIHNKITRQEMAAMAYRAIQKAGITLTEEQAGDFHDAQDIASYAKEAVTAMHQAGIINGVGNGNFNPKGTATRAEAAVILYQLLMKSL